MFMWNCKEVQDLRKDKYYPGPTLTVFAPSGCGMLGKIHLISKMARLSRRKSYLPPSSIFECQALTFCLPTRTLNHSVKNQTHLSFHGAPAKKGNTEEKKNQPPN